jgi:monoamine oxidase
LTVKAGAVIVAIPPSMRAGIHFSPALPPVHAGFIQRAPMGSISKVHAVYNTPFWRDKCLSGSAAGNLAGDLAGSASELKTCEFIADCSPPPGTPHSLMPGILTSFIAGERNLQLSHASGHEVRKAVLDDFVYYFGPKAANPVEFVHIDWNSQNWTGGAYTAYLSPGVWTAYGAGLREPVGPIFWAGTETSSLWPGYFDGAVHAGRNAAAEVLERGILQRAA